VTATVPAGDSRDGIDIRIEALDAPAFAEALGGLSELLVDAVDSGASVNFLAGLGPADARAWWAARSGSVAEGSIIPFVARSEDGIEGAVLLMPAMTQNGAHRAEVGKLIVHRRARNRGIATALLAAAEAHARRTGRWLLVLDTESGSPADALYRSRGWQVTGIVPDFARHTDGTLGAATFFWKDLRTDAEHAADEAEREGAQAGGAVAEAGRAVFEAGWAAEADRAP
jgi:GNAT superfamily N-acetyltransferase